MMMNDHIPMHKVVWGLRHTLSFFTLSSASICALYAYWPWAGSSVPMSVVGTALSIYLGFRVSASYDRWWEGRKLWGKLINYSRIFARQVTTLIEAADQGEEASAELKRLREELIKRHIAYVHALRCSLRAEPLKADEDCALYLSAGELDQLSSETNPCNALIQWQGERLSELAQRGALNEYRYQQLDMTLAELLNIQGGCERILKTPIPPTYTYLPTRLVFVYSLLLSEGLVHYYGWWAIPMSVAVSFLFRLIDTGGRLLQNPFSTFYYGLPLKAMSRMIEANLCDRIETPARPIPQPIDGVLM